MEPVDSNENGITPVKRRKVDEDQQISNILEGSTQEYALLISDDSLTEDNTLEDSNTLESSLTLIDEVKDENKNVVPSSAQTSDTFKTKEDDMLNIKKLPSITRDAKIISSIVPNSNYNVIYNELLANRENDNRLNLVTSNLLERDKSEETEATTANDSKIIPQNSITEQVDVILKLFPETDKDLVQAILESLKGEENIVDKAINELGLKTEVATNNTETLKPNLLKKISTSVDDPYLANDSLFSDMRKVAKLLPNYDRNEIYALLEANIHRPNRVEVVMNELLRIEASKGGSQTFDASLNSSFITSLNSSFDVSIVQTPVKEPPLGWTLNNNVPGQNHEGKLPGLDNHYKPSEDDRQQFDEDVEYLHLLFPDCDPIYLSERLAGMKADIDKRKILAEELADSMKYPKLKDRLEKEKRAQDQEQQNRFRKEFTIDEFLEKFSDPKTTFGDKARVVSDVYKQHANAALKNEFLMLKTSYIQHKLEQNNYHFYITFKELFDVVVSTPLAKRQTCKKFMKTQRRKMVTIPLKNDVFFYHEHWFAHNELKVEDYVMEKAVIRTERIQSAKEKGELYECCCCFEDECLFEDLASCPEGHLFCKECVIRSTEAAFGEMKTRFPCLTGECDQDIPLSTLQSIIPANLFSKIVSRLQEEEVLKADIPDLVTCPFCPFATIMPGLEDKVLKCLNPECLKESCRLCREENHIPLRCDEVESRAGVSMRTFIENKVAEAVMRKCHKCGKRFLKDSGCNKMTCVCGATSCYNCKKEDIDYDHFQSNKKCNETDPKTIHERDMRQAAKEAMQEYILKHPESADLELQSTDLIQMIQDGKPINNNNKKKEGGSKKKI